MGKKKKNTQAGQKFTCPNPSCGLIFSKPLKVKNLSLTNSESYNACPYCFSAVIMEEGPVVGGKPTTQVDDSRVEGTVCVHEEIRTEPPTATQCAYHFGYLSERRKSEKIPEECIVCENIVKCMLKAING
jgi:hypothetical protein